MCAEVRGKISKFGPSSNIDLKIVFCDYRAISVLMEDLARSVLLVRQTISLVNRLVPSVQMDSKCFYIYAMIDDINDACVIQHCSEL